MQALLVGVFKGRQGFEGVVAQLFGQLQQQGGIELQIGVEAGFQRQHTTGEGLAGLHQLRLQVAGAVAALQLQIQAHGDAGLNERLASIAVGREPGQAELQIGHIQPGAGEQFGAAGVERGEGGRIQTRRQAEGAVTRFRVQYQEFAHRAGVEVEAEAEPGIHIDAEAPVGLDVKTCGDVDVDQLLDQGGQAGVIAADAPVEAVAEIQLEQIEQRGAHRRIVVGAFTGEGIGAGPLHQGEGDVAQAGLIHGLVEAAGPFVGGQDRVGEAAHRVGNGVEAGGDVVEIDAQRSGHAADQRVGAEVAHQGIAQLFDAAGQAGEHRQPVGR